MRKIVNFIPLPILAIGLSLRLISLNQSLWLDEATSAIAAKMDLVSFFGSFIRGDFHPPLYYLLLKAWSAVFGYSEISLRVPSVIFGVATIYLVYLLGKRIYDGNVGIIASLLLATSGLHIYYSQEARMYSLAAFLVTLAIYLFLKEKWILFSVSLCLIAMADYVSLIIIPALFVYSVLSKKDSNWRKKYFLSHIPLLAVFSLWLPIFTTQLKNGIGLSTTSPNWWNILGQVTLKNIALIPVKFAFGRISIDNNLIYFAISALTLSVFGYLILKAKKSALIQSWLITSLITGIILSLFIPTLTYFRYLFVLPAFYLLIAAGLSSLGTKKLIVSLLFVLSVNILSSVWYLFSPSFHREDWRSASITLGAEKIVFPSDSQKEALIYYGKENNIISVDEERLQDRQIWLSRYVWEIFDPTDSTRFKLEALGYNKVNESSFNGVVFWKYIK